MSSMPIDLVLGTDSLQAPLTGIGRYTYELARGVLRAPEIRAVRGYDLGRLHDLQQRLQRVVEIPQVSGGTLRRAASRSVLATSLYRYYVHAASGPILRRYAGALFHSPNFHLPRHPGRKVVTMHDLSYRLFPECHPRARVRWMNRMVPEALAAADQIICVSVATRDDLLREYLLDPARVSVVPLGVDAVYRPRTAAETRDALAPHGLTHGGFILCVSTLEPRKNLDLLLDAYLALAAPLRARWPLVLAGGYGWGADALRARLECLRGEGVRYLGFVAQETLPALYSAAACFVFPSRYEGFGLPVLEAQASGVPVITSRVSSLPEVAGPQAVLVGPGDAQAFAHALQRAVEDPQWRRECATSGLYKAREFSWERCVQATIDVYQLALAE